MMGIASNPFFSSIETGFSDCPLAYRATEISPQMINEAVLDRPLAKDPEAAKNFSSAVENPPRELTEDEKKRLQEVLGWSDKQVGKCTIDAEGIIHYKTDRCDLEGKTSENGVPYEWKQVEIKGIVIEGVFPEFDSAFDAYLDPEDYTSKSYATKCNAKLKEAVNRDPELRSKFTQSQLEQIESGVTPDGYVWHHNEEPGKMQLVKKVDHDRCIGGAAHTGGSALWGPDSVAKEQKGERF